jgi:hypothetical protein
LFFFILILDLLLQLPLFITVVVTNPSFTVCCPAARASQLLLLLLLLAPGSLPPSMLMCWLITRFTATF